MSKNSLKVANEIVNKLLGLAFYDSEVVGNSKKAAIRLKFYVPHDTVEYSWMAGEHYRVIIVKNGKVINDVDDFVEDEEGWEKYEDAARVFEDLWVDAHAVYLRGDPYDISRTQITDDEIPF